MQKRLKNKKAIILGGSKGIGKEIAKSLKKFVKMFMAYPLKKLILLI